MNADLMTAGFDPAVVTRIREAFTKGDSWQWASGDAALEAIPIGVGGYSETTVTPGGTLGKIAIRIADLAKAAGVEVDALRAHRDVANAWPLVERFPVDVAGWSVHRVLRNHKDVLATLVKQAEEAGRSITVAEAKKSIVAVTDTPSTASEPPSLSYDEARVLTDRINGSFKTLNELYEQAEPKKGPLEWADIEAEVDAIFPTPEAKDEFLGRYDIFGTAGVDAAGIVLTPPAISTEVSAKTPEAAPTLAENEAIIEAGLTAQKKAAQAALEMLRSLSENDCGFHVWLLTEEEQDEWVECLINLFPEETAGAIVAALTAVSSAVAA